MLIVMPEYPSTNFAVDVSKLVEHHVHVVLLNSIAVARGCRHVNEVAAFVIDYVMVCY